jgi:hypothetical protein
MLIPEALPEHAAGAFKRRKPLHGAQDGGRFSLLSGGLNVDFVWTKEKAG